MKRTRRNLEPSALELVEEAVHLLRGTPAATLAVYYVGVVPWVLGLLFAWAYATWFQPTTEQVAWGALALVVLFGVMKAAQAEFCGRLLAVRSGTMAPAWSRNRFVRLIVTQTRFQAAALLAELFAAVMFFPFGWSYAYAQNASVLADDDRLHEKSLEQALLWPAQNHLGLLLFSVLSLAIWLNLGAAFLAVPWLANRLLGVENIFGFSGWWFFNTTFVASVTALTWLAVDPLVKTFYTLRLFHGRARRDGEDIRVELQLARRTRRAAPMLAALIFLLALYPGAVRAAESSAPPTVVQPADLDRAIEGVLEGPQFRWRLRPLPSPKGRAEEGAIARFFSEGFRVVKEMFKTIGRWLGGAFDWLEGFFGGGNDSGASKSAAGATSTLRVLLYLFIGIAVLLILWLVWLIVRRARPSGATVVMAQPVTTAAPDLRDESVQAAQLPADGWLALAREQAARGEWRLALRALYLATLARLAAENLITLAAFKTNLDYEREVRRRALSREEVAVNFAIRRREFEAVWYGKTVPAEGGVRAWLAELENRVTS